MITSLNLIRNIGRFDSITNGNNHPFAQLTLIYAENGRGKTTLSAILRSLATGDPIPVNERRRLGAANLPHAIISCSGGPPDAMFQNGAWNRTLPDVLIFDDVFVDENVYSGLVVGSDHRQNLHELILGSQGVTLNQQLQALITQIEQHNREIRRRGAEIPATERGTLSVDDFCAIQANLNIDQEIQTAEQNLAASRQQDPIRTTSELPQLSLPGIDLPEIEAVLSAGLPDLDTAAAAQVQAHFERIGEESEQWVSEGMERQHNLEEGGDHSCPFCAQDLGGSSIINHYRSFFGQAYRDHQQNIRDCGSRFFKAHPPDTGVLFERTVNSLQERRRFWSDFGDIPEFTIDAAAIVAEWNEARNQIEALFQQKASAPLDSIETPEATRTTVATYYQRLTEVAGLNQQIQTANQTIAAVKQRAATANTAALTTILAILKATKARHTPANDALCQAYLAEKQAKANTEQQRDQARQALEQYRTQVFPTYEAAINRYLQRFNAGYHPVSYTHL
ncbi:MAG: hypothetical protein N838_31225 [Thiohalocapsa sp. PB-PSB1]|nr:MAG: hypothetical protein N838_31225 [Thiohalocapsa sp. PB-PSB1]